MVLENKSKEVFLKDGPPLRPKSGQGKKENKVTPSPFFLLRKKKAKLWLFLLLDKQMFFNKLTFRTWLWGKAGFFLQKTSTLTAPQTKINSPMFSLTHKNNISCSLPGLKEFCMSVLFLLFLLILFTKLPFPHDYGPIHPKIRMSDRVQSMGGGGDPPRRNIFQRILDWWGNRKRTRKVRENEWKLLREQAQRNQSWANRPSTSKGKRP